ncbi:MAG: pentapeptide repeat-containing protein [Cyanobacteria bacterium P01_A01_bin.68]
MQNGRDANLAEVDLTGANLQNTN